MDKLNAKEFTSIIRWFAYFFNSISFEEFTRLLKEIYCNEYMSEEFIHDNWDKMKRSPIAWFSNDLSLDHQFEISQRILAVMKNSQ